MFVPTQWEMVSDGNNVSPWLLAGLELAPYNDIVTQLVEIICHTIP